MVDGFTFLGSNDGPAQHSSPQTPLSSNKRTLRDLWDRTDVDGIGGPSTPTKRRLPFDEDAPSSSQVEVPETPLPSSTPGTDHSDSETDAGEEMSSIARGKQPQRRRKGRKKKGQAACNALNHALHNASKGNVEHDTAEVREALDNLRTAYHEADIV
ncbi:hypothetical protein V8E54_002703 [Elaphomyces granulatus]